MRRAFLFNPENDLALARNVAAFTPPPAAIALRRAGELLPMWLCNMGDCFICDGVNAGWFEKLIADFDIAARPWDHNSTDSIPTPWGWSAAVRRTFAQRGFPASALPDDSQLSTLRELSHRRTGAAVARALAASLPFEVWPAAEEYTDATRIANALRQCPCVVKSPWSSSGRGITFTTPDRAEAMATRAAGIIRTQGSVMVELAATRVCDFAMLWHYDRGACQWAGYSLFETDDRGDYHANIVAPQAELERRIADYTDTEQLRTIRTALPEALRSVLGEQYSGPVGVDMLIDANGTIDPVVEINLRYTMGFIALALQRHTATEARFIVERGDTTASCKYTTTNGRLTDGRVALSQPGCDFTFVLEGV